MAKTSLSPEQLKNKEAVEDERIRSRINRSTDDSECWEWTRYCGPTGHGRAYFRGRIEYAHRIAFYFEHGYFPEVVRHKCDNPACCNPSHLIAGTASENMRDRTRRHRGAWQQSYGQFSNQVRAGLAKRADRKLVELTQELIDQVKDQHKAGVPRKAIRTQFGISEQIFSRIVYCDSVIPGDNNQQ